MTLVIMFQGTGEISSHVISDTTYPTSALGGPKYPDENVSHQISGRVVRPNSTPALYIYTILSDKISLCT